MDSIVISLGGSVVISDDVDISFFIKLVDLLTKISLKYKIYLVVGGGKTARIYIKFGREMNLDEKILDQIGIDVTRVNARILTSYINDSNKEIPKTVEQAIRIDKPIVVMGGTTPGHSTDMVGAELAEKTKALKFIIATNVDGIYNKDPNKHSNAKQLKTVTIKNLIEKFGTRWDSAGKNIVIDGPALEIINRAKIPTFVLNGKKIDQLEKAISDKEFIGTIIKI